MKTTMLPTYEKILSTTWLNTGLFAQYQQDIWPCNQTYPQDCTVFFMQLNGVYNKIKNKVLPPYVKFALPQDGRQGILFLFFFNFSPYCVQANWLQLKKIYLDPSLIFDILSLFAEYQSHLCPNISATYLHTYMCIMRVLPIHYKSLCHKVEYREFYFFLQFSHVAQYIQRSPFSAQVSFSVTVLTLRQLQLIVLISRKRLMSYQPVGPLNHLWVVQCIVNLKQFNFYMHIPTYKMHTIRQVW